MKTDVEIPYLVTLKNARDLASACASIRPGELIFKELNKFDQPLMHDDLRA